MKHEKINRLPESFASKWVVEPTHFSPTLDPFSNERDSFG
jgi:hypothetical protein